MSRMISNCPVKKPYINLNRFRFSLTTESTLKKRPNPSHQEISFFPKIASRNKKSAIFCLVEIKWETLKKYNYSGGPLFCNVPLILYDFPFLKLQNKGNILCIQNSQSGNGTNFVLQSKGNIVCIQDSDSKILRF